MFGKNKPHTYRDYTGAPNTLKVTSIFPTLQGEGPFAGHPAIFLRLTGCNLQCSFCDTYFDTGEEMTFTSINKAITDLTKAAFPYASMSKVGLPSPVLVVTGGEPLLQKNLTRFLNQRNGNEIVQIETAGTLNLVLPSWAYVVISPKINETTNGPIKVSPEMLGIAKALKFVVSASEDMKGYNDIPQWALAWRDRAPYTRAIYVSPMNMYSRAPDTPGPLATAEERAERERISFWTPGLLDAQANQRNHEHAAQLAMRYNCILSLQQHLYAGLP